MKLQYRVVHPYKPAILATKTPPATKAESEDGPRKSEIDKVAPFQKPASSSLREPHNEATSLEWQTRGFTALKDGPLCFPESGPGL